MKKYNSHNQISQKTVRNVIANSFLNCSQRAITYLLIFFVLGCASTRDFEPSMADPGIPKITSSKVTITKTHSPLSSLPQIKALVNKIQASKIATSSIALSRSVNISANSNSGVAPDTKGGLESYADASIVAEKPIYDGDRISLRTQLSEIETQSLLVGLELALNEIVAEITEQQLTIGLTDEAIKVIDASLADYEQNKPMLETLVNAGVVQKLEFLDLRQKIQGIEASRHAFDTKQRQAETILKTKYAVISSIKTPSFEKIKNINLEQLDGLQLKELKLKEQNLRLNRQLKRADKSWGVTFATTATVKTNDNDPQLFSGLKFSLPIYDGGAIDAALASLDEQIEALTAEIDAYEVSKKTAKSTWSQNIQAYAGALEINTAQIALVLDRQIDLDRQLSAGRVKLDQVVSNKLTLLDLSLKKIELKQTAVAQAFEVIRLFGAGCKISDVCGEINDLLESL